MITVLPTARAEAEDLQPPKRLTTQSLRDDEIRAIADSAYRDDNPLRFEGVRQAALMFERAGYVITRSEDFRPLATPPQEVVVGQLVVDALRRLVFHDGREIELKPREFDLLEVLARHPGQVFTRTHLLDLVWPRDFDGDWRTIDVHVRRIRRRLGEPPNNPRLIVTVHGVGYKLASPHTLRLA
jgi:DNA-binding response OmpR family regulator